MSYYVNESTATEVPDHMKKRSFTRRALALMLALLCAAPMLPALSTAASAEITEAQIDALEAERDEIRAQREEMQAGIDELKGEQDSLLEQKYALDAQNELYRQELELIDEQLELYGTLVSQKQREVEMATSAETEQLAAYKRHVRALEEDGNYTYLAIIFGSSSLGQLISNLDMIGEVMEADRRIYDQYTAAREQSEEIQSEYAALLGELEERSAEYESERAELEERIEEANQLIVQLEEEIQTNTELFLEVVAQEEALEANIQQMIADFERQEAAKNIKSTGTYIWPLPGYTPGTRTYGYRMHPILGYMRFHSGQDIGAPSGTSIIAADSGVVSYCGWNGGYGNCVMINHGGGRVTLYAHMSAYNCSYGQTVTQGDTIGYVGSTGMSTGPHLHFEVRINGATVDPMQYFSIGG